MKNILYITALLGVLLFASCKKSACDNQYCQNGGTCNNGECTCPPGYSGLHCDSNHIGLVTFWAAAKCSSAPISVTCDGFTASMSEYYATDSPTCGSPGCANFRLAAGTYNYTATGTDSSWTGSVTVTQGGCTLKQLGCITGNVTFWFNTAGNAATVNIGGNVAHITTAYTSTTPNCGATGCANFTLSPGTYTYSAVSSSNNWSGSVTVTANGCTLQLLQ